MNIADLIFGPIEEANRQNWIEGSSKQGASLADMIRSGMQKGILSPEQGMAGLLNLSQAEEEKQKKTQEETSLANAGLLNAQVQATPEIQPGSDTYNPEAYSYSQGELAKMLAGGGQEGRQLLTSKMTTPKTDHSITETELAVKAAQGDPLSKAALQELIQQKQATKENPLDDRRLTEQGRHNREMEKRTGLQEQLLALQQTKALRTEEEAAKKSQTQMNSSLTKADIVIKNIDEALKQTGWGTTGLVGDLRSTLPGRLTGSESYNLEKTIDTIKANIGFQELNDMRVASPTGGALGQIAVKELEFLQSALGSLDKGQSEEQLRKNLNAIKEHYQNWKATVEKAKGGAITQPSTPQRRSTDRGTGAVRRYNPATGRIE